MMYYLYSFEHTPPQTRPVGMRGLIARGMYLNEQKAMKYMKLHIKEAQSDNGKPITHLGLYGNNDNLVMTEKV